MLVKPYVTEFLMYLGINLTTQTTANLLCLHPGHSYAGTLSWNEITAPYLSLGTEC